ncbi:MAG: SPOR domain-containing protein [Sulfuritalea sp.]|nr:SPOR domain-containing protein [Sulfuritalea sp.]
MAEQSTSPDAELQLKKRARRRLVGAVALALLAVIVLPMVMDSDPRPPSQDIQVRIPSQDSMGLAAKVLPGKPSATPMPAPEPKTEVKVTPPEPAAAPVSVATPAAKPTEVSSSSAKKSESADQPATKAAEVAASGSDQSAQWVVQLGAYKEAGNVKLLLSKLKGVGVPAYTEKYESAQGPRTRVRAGPFASQEAAEKARSRIRIIGVDGPVAPR